ncbi:hypothetical protein GO013_15225 [Pseudodesulfovibrio sp. JC047]|uniref:hypothetical protein n=1 Tax=Pseudodesulfovibrio sp. JC047 TaxID=2683199 RepID=UPI0013D13BA5|nr:hypothetical protein [Pseudodesulfovibrio sp. JC047]NDV20760.1 hypothetical protein [Pseudodesulfovibrio sp. JC047]
MAEKMQQKRRDMGKIWPRIVDFDSAHRAAMQGVWACGIIAGFTVLNMIMFMVDFPGQVPDVTPLIYVVFFAFLGVGIYRKYRCAAVAGLGLYVYIFISKIVMDSVSALIGAMFAVFFILALTNGLRGVYKWHALKLGAGPIS